MLKQNMRQKLQTVEDAKLRRCLKNMRYQACDKEDKAFLKTLRVGKNNGKLLSDPRFHNVSIITHFNACRDTVNEKCVEDRKSVV